MIPEKMHAFVQSRLSTHRWLLIAIQSILPRWVKPGTDSLIRCLANVVIPSNACWLLSVGVLQARQPHLADYQNRITLATSSGGILDLEMQYWNDFADSALQLINTDGHRNDRKPGRSWKKKRLRLWRAQGWFVRAISSTVRRGNPKKKNFFCKTSRVDPLHVRQRANIGSVILICFHCEPKYRRHCERRRRHKTCRLFLITAKPYRSTIEGGEV
jgi:hypothetical protein